MGVLRPLMFYRPVSEELDLLIIRWQGEELAAGGDELVTDLATATIEKRPPSWEGEGFTPTPPVGLPDLTGYHLYFFHWKEEPNEGFRANIEATADVIGVASRTANNFGNEGSSEFAEDPTAFVGNPTVQLILKIAELEEFPGEKFTGYFDLYLGKPAAPVTTPKLVMLI